MSRVKDLKDQRFGRLLVLEHVGFTKDRNAIWKCRCDCGNEKIVPACYLGKSTTSCGCYAREVLGTYHKLPYGEAAFNGLYLTYQLRAAKRNLEFTLTKVEFRKLSQDLCKYCGITPHRTFKVNKRVGEYIYNGVDRIDNTKGYVLDNCVTCCYDCNRMKHTMPHATFLQHIERISVWQKNIH